MNVASAQSKVYIEILHQLRNMMQEGGLKTGDKIPSERELSERLSVGRSSVREALRALELLGIIETKRGEGTFLKDFRNHQLVELLGTFILQDEEVKEDLEETKRLIEKNAIQLACKNMTEKQLTEIREHINNKSYSLETLLTKIFESIDNRLLRKIWVIITEYNKIVCHEHREISPRLWLELIQCFEHRDEAGALRVYDQIQKNLSNNN
jgi:GntR family transcriptional regulator, transcriptional repressor for pyruvate dehydrogenase complex